MSFITGGAVEVLYASTVAGAAAAASAETQINDTATMGVQARLQPDFWLPNQNQLAKAIKITARGILSTGTVAPNLTWTIRAGAAGTSGPILLSSAANALLASVAGGPWQLEADVILSTMGAAGAHSTIQGYGDFMSYYTGQNWPWVLTGTAATLDTSITNFINVNCLFSTTGCSITCQQLLVYGLN